MSKQERPSSGTTGLRRLLLVGGCCTALFALPAAASANPLNFSTGSAYTLGLKTSLLSTTVMLGPAVGPVTSNTTTDTKASAATVDTALANANVLSAEVVTTNEYAHSTAQVASLKTAPSLGGISATALSSTATATCRQANPVVGGSSTGTVVIGGQTYNIASEPPNTTIPLGPLGGVTLNEQIVSGRSITVNAIDIKTVAGTQLVVASASASMSGCFFG